MTILHEAMVKLGERLEQALSPRIPVMINSTLPVVVPETGVVLLNTGDPGERDEYFSPRTFIFRPVLHLRAQIADEDDVRRAHRLDELLARVGEVLAAEAHPQPLDGLVLVVDPGMPSRDHVQIDTGSLPVAGALIPVTLEYDSESPLG